MIESAHRLPERRPARRVTRTRATWENSAAVELSETFMTYCVGVLLEKGLIFASDSRTHAGVDNFAKFCKMTLFERNGERVIVLLSSGNLAGTQAVITILRQRADVHDAQPNIWTARTMFDVAGIVSDAVTQS